ncbi:hypothetical protein [Paenibacillus caui]|uniref:hypothetical protein n=1 Tax=Paenibacillus caui TaxID=2873927 RepID=UPI001CA7B9CF|nr:hypothetical protein [Paenibacillus caui]
MKKYMLYLTFIVTIILSACSNIDFKPDTFSQDDMGIVQIDSGNKVIYGMSRTEAEDILGTGDKSALGMIDYKSGVSVFYRDDSVAGIALREHSNGHYKTTRGAEIKMLKGKIKKMYGEKHAIDQTPLNLDYAYDSKEGKFLNKISPKSEDDAKSTYVISAIFNSDGYAERIMILDSEFAIYLK